MTRYRDKYRIESTRLRGWDYRRDGYYFITICTKNRQHFFGEIANGVMVLNETGQVVQKYWYEIPLHFPHVQLDAFVVMPDHIHGIMILQSTFDNRCNNKSTNGDDAEPNYYSRISPKPQSLSTIIRSYKSICTKMIGVPIWQSGFYEHIIRNEPSLQKIRNYIINNPTMWNDDENSVKK
ncbi:MAG: REP-associated tyrosine transposase [Bacteroidales bacterium]|jgi:REP element-mobilizing transposase RayT|nr:REP-associated tyrosine transposase [Bacteroidales bacterium]